MPRPDRDRRSAAPSAPLSRAAAATALLVLLLFLAALALSRGLRDRVDWSYWRLAAEAVQRDGLPPLWSETYGYPPHVPLLWMPLTLWLPRAIGVTLYVLTCTAMAWWIVRTVGREWLAVRPPPSESPPTHWTLTQLIPVLLVLVPAANSFHQNQLSIPVLFGIVLALTLVRRNHPWLGGAILGATISIKLVPLPILGILLIKRAWRPVAAAVAGGLLFAAVPCLLCYGPVRTVQASAEWLWRLRLVSPDSQIQHFPLLDADRSQALVSVLNRWFADRPAAREVRIIVTSADDALARPAESYFDTTPPTLRIRAPRRLPPEAKIAPLPTLAAPRLATLSRATIQAIHWSVVGLLALGTVAVCRRSVAAASDARFYADMSLALLVSVLLTPVVFAYYLVWAYPAWALVAARFRSATRWARILIAITIAIWLAAQAALLWPPARQSGANLWAVLLLCIALAIVARNVPTAARAAQRCE